MSKEPGKVCGIRIHKCICNHPDCQQLVRSFCEHIVNDEGAIVRRDPFRAGYTTLPPQQPAVQEGESGTKTNKRARRKTWLQHLGVEDSPDAPRNQYVALLHFPRAALDKRKKRAKEVCEYDVCARHVGKEKAAQLNLSAVDRVPFVDPKEHGSGPRYFVAPNFDMETVRQEHEEMIQVESKGSSKSQNQESMAACAMNAAQEETDATLVLLEGNGPADCHMAGFDCQTQQHETSVHGSISDSRTDLGQASTQAKNNGLWTIPEEDKVQSPIQFMETHDDLKGLGDANETRVVDAVLEPLIIDSDDDTPIGSVSGSIFDDTDDDKTQEDEASMFSRASSILQSLRERVSAFSKRADYTCPRCNGAVWAWKAFEGVPCLHCMGNGKLEKLLSGLCLKMSENEISEAWFLAKLVGKIVSNISKVGPREYLKLVVNYRSAVFTALDNLLQMLRRETDLDDSIHTQDSVVDEEIADDASHNDCSTKERNSKKRKQQ